MNQQFKPLIKLKSEHLALKHPSVPKHALPKPKYKSKNANSLTRAIIDYLNLSGHQAERISSSGRWIEIKNSEGHKIGQGQWIPGTGTKGTADISATIFGKSVKIEVKIGKDKQSDHQIRYQEQILKAGGFYWIAKDFDHFLEQYTLFSNSHRPDGGGCVSAPTLNPSL
jgi:hypothetical protein